MKMMRSVLYTLPWRPFLKSPTFLGRLPSLRAWASAQVESWSAKSSAPVADGIKSLTKEDIVPTNADVAAIAAVDHANTVTHWVKAKAGELGYRRADSLSRE